MSKRQRIDEDGEIRPLTAAEIAAMTPIRQTDPGMLLAVEAFRRGRGRPSVPQPKSHISFRMAPDVIDGIKATGRGYSARVEKVLREALAKGTL